MVTVTTYNVYVSGTLKSEVFSGDIDPATRMITIKPYGGAMISIELVNLLDTDGGEVTFAAQPISFAGAKPDFVCWDLMSPTQLQLGDINYNNVSFAFNLVTSHGGLGDPTIVNTYPPPPRNPGECEHRHHGHERHERRAPAPATPRRVA
jgi:hypothetical protein